MEARSYGAKWQARNADPRNGGSERGNRCGGGKGRHEHAVPGRVRCGVLRGFDPVAGNTVIGELKSDASGDLVCNVQYRACRW